MRIIAAAAAALLLGAPALAADEAKPTTVKERYSYLVGLEVARSFQRDGVEVDPRAFALAVEDVFAGREPRLSPAELKQAAADRREAFRREREALMAAKAREEAAFLARFRAREGVQEAGEGVLYRVIEPGTGESPDTDSEVTVNYRGTLTDGTEFDSSYARGKPARLNLARVIPGWREVLPLMREGAHWEIAVPADQAYGSRGVGGVIGPGEALLFEVELVEVH